jgi:hypothetical protein
LQLRRDRTAIVSIGWLGLSLKPSALRIPWPSGDFKVWIRPPEHRPILPERHRSRLSCSIHQTSPRRIGCSAAIAVRLSKVKAHLFIQPRMADWSSWWRSVDTAQSWQSTLISIDQLAAGVVGHRRCLQMGRDAGFRRGRKARQFHSQAPARECLERL